MRSANKAMLGIVGVFAVVLVIALMRSHRSQTLPVVTGPETAASPGVLDNRGEIESLKGQLARERGLRQRAEAESAELRNKPIAPPVTNVVAVARKVEEVGKQAGTFLPAMAELSALTGRDPSTLTGEEKRRLLELQRDHAKFLGALPEITAYQDNPEQYGRFFRSMIQEAAGLNDGQATQVEEFMRQRGTMMNELGLNSAKEPTDPKLEEAWEERRDQFNEQTAAGLKAILPPGAGEKAGLSAELMEFLEMDFDKITPKGLVQAPER